MLFYYLSMLSTGYADEDDCDGGGSLPTATMQSTGSDLMIMPEVPGLLTVDDRFGSALALGDFNGDGIDDLAVGIPMFDDGALTNAGAVAIYWGALGFSELCPAAGCATPFTRTDAPDVLLRGTAAGQNLGRALSTAGNLTGDASDELLAGGVDLAIILDVSLALPDAPANPWVTLQAPALAGSDFGHLVGHALIGGTNVLWVGQRLSHKVHVYRDVTALLVDPALEVVWANNPSNFILSATAIGDWDNDGYRDVAIGCPQCSLAQKNTMVFSGWELLGANDLNGGNAPGANGPLAAYAAEYERLGTAVAPLPNGAMAIGAPKFNNTRGRVVVVDANTPNPLPGSVGVLPGVPASNLGLGNAVASGEPEANGDVVIVAGSPGASAVNVARGMVRISEKPTTTGTIPTQLSIGGPPHTSAANGSRFGQAVAVGDLNGDLFDDVIIGAPYNQTLDPNGNPVSRGAVFVVFGGLDGFDGNLVEQYLDEDGDGFGTGEVVVRCELMDGYSEVDGDCDDTTTARAPGNLELCATAALDDDCEPSNDGLCYARLNAPGAGGSFNPRGAQWCAASHTWTIGPRTVDTVSIFDLATMVDEGKLFLEDTLDASPAGDELVSSVSDEPDDCASNTGMPTITLDVITNNLDDAAAAISPYDGLFTDVVLDTLRAHPDGYLIGSLSQDPSSPKLVILGGGYPGLVNGVVDLLRAMEGGASWTHRTMMDYPEVKERVLRWGASMIYCSAESTPANSTLAHNLVPADYGKLASTTKWESCLSNFNWYTGSQAKQILDVALRYHYSTIAHSSMVHNALSDQENYGWSTMLHASNLIETILYLRRRGIDVHQYLPMAPVSPSWTKATQQGGEKSEFYEPNAIFEMPFEPVPVGAEYYAFPCDDDRCMDPQGGSSPALLTPSVLASEKYWMPITGDDAGVVYARNMLRDPVEAPIGTTCTVELVSDPLAPSACDGPCFCTEGATVNNDEIHFALERDTDVRSATLFLADSSAPEPPSAPNPPNSRDEWKYHIWGERQILPGRLYALHGKVQVENCTLGGPPYENPTFPPADSPFRFPQKGDYTPSNDELVVAPADDACIVAIDLRLRTYSVEAHNRSVYSRVTVQTPAAPNNAINETDNFSFVFRAPLQRSELPTDSFSDLSWQIDPQVRLDATLLGGNLAELNITHLTLVELDGTSSGWLMDDDVPPGGPPPPSLAPRITDHPAVAEFEVDPSILNYSCVLGDPTCIPYATAEVCGAGQIPYTNIPSSSWQRFTEQSDPILATDHITRIRLVDAQTPIIRLSGVQHEIIGSTNNLPCTRFASKERTTSNQANELLHPSAWSTEGVSFVSQLEFLAEPRNYGVYQDHSIQDFLFGHEETRYSWHQSSDAIFTNILSESPIHNMNFAGWGDGVYRPISHHQTIRALFCNAARAVRRADWTQPFNQHMSYCDFARPGEDCTVDDVSGLTGSEPCPLDPLPAGAPEIKLVIDSNMHQDSSTFQLSPDEQMQRGAVATAYLSAHVTPDGTPPSATTSLSATLAENVQTHIWNYSSTIHEIMENVCDVAPVQDLFVGQPALLEPDPITGAPTGLYEATPETRQACMMSNLSTPNRIRGLSALGEGLDSPQLWASFAAGYPNLVESVGVVLFDGDGAGGGKFPTLDNPEWGLAARCLWNPEWKLLQAVSVSTAVYGNGESPWCEPGSNWSGGGGYEAGDGTYQYFCEDGPENPYINHEYADCVRGPLGDGVLRMAMRPELSSLVSLDGVEAGERVRVVIPVGYEHAGHPERTSCLGAKGILDLVHPFDDQSDDDLVFSDVPRIRLFFVDGDGTILPDQPTDVPLPPIDQCQTPMLSLSSTAFEATPVPDRYPYLINSRGEAASQMRFRLTQATDVPVGAVAMGMSLEVPGVELVGYEPVISTVLFEHKVPSDPTVIPGGSLLAMNAAYGYEPSFGTRTDIPRSCDDSQWLRWSRYIALNAAVSMIETAECYGYFASIPEQP
jgi:hypothetical protein